MGTIPSQITNLTIVYSTLYSDADQRKYQSSASLAFVRGIHRIPVNSPHKWPVTRKMFPFDDVITPCIACPWLPSHRPWPEPTLPNPAGIRPLACHPYHVNTNVSIIESFTVVSRKVSMYHDAVDSIYDIVKTQSTHTHTHKDRWFIHEIRTSNLDTLLAIILLHMRLVATASIQYYQQRFADRTNPLYNTTFVGTSSIAENTQIAFKFHHVLSTYMFHINSFNFPMM